MLEISGSERNAKADRLAESLRGALSGVANIVRPVKSAEVRISGLDETATKEGVAAVVAKATGIDVGLVKAGALRSGFYGTSSIVVSCPISAAKTLTEKGRLLIGWSSARVTALEALPMRCFKYMGLGHTRPQCPASVDRGDLCFRCGRAGHKAAACEEVTPRCAICVESDKPSDHRMGGRRCKPAKIKCRSAGARATPAAASQIGKEGVVPSVADGEEVVMSECMDQIRHHNFLQANLNHCARAQDLLMQALAQWRIDVAVAAEPYFVPSSHPCWAADLNGTVAIVSRSNDGSLPFSVEERGPGYVVAKWGEYAVVGAYFSPNKTVAELEAFLDLLVAAVGRQAPRQVVLLGDLNAKARDWGNPFTDSRGEVVREWAVTAGLTLLITGSAHTCVRHNGGSVMDLSFASPSIAARVQTWRVLSEVETLSDHKYVRFEVSTSHSRGAPRHAALQFPRWAVTRLDVELAKEAAIVQLWSATPMHPEVDIAADHFRDAVTAVCDAAMPRCRHRPERRGVYWWSSEIAEL
ncbi:uncharacterized protein LOC123663086 [Melitaea cinxia]|uniref:uncharacterized protein LOC123663086 n=1 Tax=Melitaea cinxia TaxID=113334 RepID=UPI001E26F5AF|nr:uncharacterized protein LOC123663086 [Melitaea cinxia]